MNRTKIEYVDYTWNPVTGCLGPGGTPEEPKRCSYCYAHRLAKGRLKHIYLAKFPAAVALSQEGKIDPFWPRFWISRMNEPVFYKESAKIFISDMGDLFGAWIPNPWIVRILETVRACPQHTFLLLTKNPARYKEFQSWPGNCWLGTTVTNQQDWDERWPEMEKVGALCKWVSFEPLLMHIGRLSWAMETPDWIVIGGLTGAGKQEPPRGVIGLTKFADFWGIPVFHKDNLDCEALGIERRQEWPR